MESKEVGEENTSTKDDASNINISSNLEDTSIIRENSLSNTKSHDCNLNCPTKTETNTAITKSNNFVDCNFKKFALLKNFEMAESKNVNESLFSEENVLPDETNSKKLDCNVYRDETNLRIVADEKEAKKEEMETISNVDNDHKGFNVQEPMQDNEKMEKIIEKKNELVERELSTKFLEFQSSTVNENNSSKSESIKDEIMEQETIIVSATIEKITVEETIEKDLPNFPTNNKALQEDKEKLSKFVEINRIKNMESDKNSIDAKSTKNSEIEKPVTSLAFIASAYDNSDSESDELECVYEERNNSNEMEVQITKEYRNKPTVATSDEESDSDDSSVKSVSSSSTAESNASDDSAKKNTNGKKKNRYKASQEKELKGEFDDLPPIEELKISVPEVLCDPLGEVGWMVEQMVVVRPKPGKPTLNLDTILFVERGRRVLGRIFDVFGQVSEPHYCVRFNSTEHIKESDIKVGMIVYFCPNTEYTSVVFLQDLLKMKATDELGDDEHPEFSDDEEERAYYASLKQKQKNDKTKSGGEIPQKRQRTDGQDPGWKSNHPWSTAKKQQQKQQAKKPDKMYKTADWSGTQQPTGCHPSNSWQYPSSYSNNSWPLPETYQGNGWPQNPFGYNEPFVNRHQQGTARPFFRPQRVFQSGPDPYMHNSPYPPQSNPIRHPAMNFSWQSQVPRQPGMSWPLSPPPPPPPGV